MLNVLEDKRQRASEYRHRFFEADPVTAGVGFGRFRILLKLDAHSP
jgi:hypothetical protein